MNVPHSYFIAIYTFNIIGFVIEYIMTQCSELKSNSPEPCFT